MSGGEIKMLATVSESTYTRLYRELAALPERKRVKRLIVLAQIGQIAEMAAMGHQLLPASDLPSPAVPAVAAPAAAATPKPTAPEPQNNAPASAAPEQPLVEKIDQVISLQPALDSVNHGGDESPADEVNTAEHPPQLPTEVAAPSAPIQAQEHSNPRKPRRSGHGFKVAMT